MAKKAGFNTLADPLSVKIDFPQNTIATSRAFLKSQPKIVRQYLKTIVTASFPSFTRDEKKAWVFLSFVFHLSSLILLLA